MKLHPLSDNVRASRVGLIVAALVFVFVFAFVVKASAQMPAKKPEVADNGSVVQNPFDAFKNFSAVMSGGLIGDKDRKIYRAGNLMRTDFPDQYRVTDIDIPATWVVFGNNAKANGKSAKCARFDVADAGTYPFWGLKDFRVDRTPSVTSSAAKETVDGHACKIDDLTFQNSASNSAVTINMKLWEAEDAVGFPIKIEVHDRITNRTFTIRYTNVKLQSPDPALFIHPDDCGDGVHTTPSPMKATPEPASERSRAALQSSITPPQ